jgi:hypothetical protein
VSDCVIQGSQPEPTYVAETLAWCNERRAEQGKKPLKKLPKGYKADGRSCPCGKATGLFVSMYYYCKHDEINAAFTHRRLPSAVSNFVIAFDNGKLPQYSMTATAQGDDQ